MTFAASGLLTRSRLLLAGACLAALAGPALAEDAPLDAGSVRVGDQGGFTLQTPQDQGYNARRVLTATRTETELSDVPQAVTVVTAQQIDDLAIQSMAEAVRYVPGVSFAQGEGNRDAPVFRGNASTADFFVDGVRDDVQYFRDVYNVERIEVLKGPNALAFGRGGSGGVINRVTKQADWSDVHEVRLEAGSWDHYRGTVDLGAGLSDALALRVTGLWQDSGSFRDDVELERKGINPTASVRLGDDSLMTVGYEHFEDRRTADRGVPSRAGRPFETDPSTFFGDPEDSFSDTELNALTAAVEHRFAGGAILRNRTRWADQDKTYQNVYPNGAVSPTGSVALAAYNNFTSRESVISQTDLNLYFDTGAVRHTLLAGFEVSRQDTENKRLTGTPAPASVPAAAPNVDATVSFTTLAVKNASVVNSVGLYVQDQIELAPALQAVVGLRYDQVDVNYLDRRTGTRIETNDGLWSPRLGVVYKPVEALSLYASYSQTFVPRAGEQLISLTAGNRAFEPEEFKNYELGVKWDARDDLTVTAALFQLDRTNVPVPDPADATRTILVDGQTTKGLELSAAGQVTERWSVIAAYAWQDAEVTERQSSSVPAGARLANTPEHSLAVWNRYDPTEQLGFGLGVVWQGARYATTDNTVKLPSFVRLDGAVYYDLNDTIGLQLNVENLLDEAYWANAHNNNNIAPGSPRAFKLGLTARF